MRFAHIHEQIYCRPWFITASAHFTIRQLFESHVARFGVVPMADLPEPSDFVNQRRPLAIDADGVASIHVLGPLGKNLSKMEKSCGSTSFEDIQSELAQANSNPAVRGILLEVDSPGGTVQGTPELAALVAASPKPIVAFTDGMMASAAYYISAGARAIVSSPSADVGSIGVYIPWVDRSALYAEAGLKPDPIVNTGGDLKALGFGGSLTPAQREFLQEQVDADFAAFQAHIAAHRDVAPSAQRGQTLSGSAAVTSGLVNFIGDLAETRLLLLSYR